MMQIVAKGTNPNKNKKGELVEMSPEEKCVLAVKQCLADHPKWTEIWKNHLAFGKNFEIKKLRHSIKGAPLKNIWANNDYTAEGTALVVLRHDKTNMLKEGKSYKFSITFSDALDNNGLPTLKFNTFKVSKK